MANSKLNIIARLQRWMDSLPGQTFLNYAYSWGAAIVILGTLFKLTHLPGADVMLFVGMGTEVFVFFISGFDRPPVEKRDDDEDGDDEELEDEELEDPIETRPVRVQRPVENEVYVTDAPRVNTGLGTVSQAPGNTGCTAADVQIAGVAAALNAEQLAEIIKSTSNQVLETARLTCIPEMEQVTKDYVGQLKQLTEVLDGVSKQSGRLTRDSEEMENLNRTLTGINTIYEMQLKSVSMQVGTIDQINEQTRKLARQIEDLNAIYSRMIKALTVNMKNSPGGIGE